MRIPIKTIERMRWEYLRRSKIYKKYCNERNKKMNPLRVEITSIAEKNIFYPVFFINSPIEVVFLKYGNVLSRDFEDYWEKKEEMDRDRDSSGLMQVMDYTEVLKYDLEGFIDQYKNTYGKKPSADEIKNSFPNFLKKKSGFNYFHILQFSFSYDEVDKIVEQVKVLLKEKLPSKRFPEKKLERYLKVYDMRNAEPRITYKQIQNKLYPNDPFTDHKKRARIYDYNKAEEIIHNIENNKFFYW